MRETDADFATYVRAWELALTRAAYLVCGDPAAAEGAVHRAFVALALHWDHVRRDDPSAFVRRALYREALAEAHAGERMPHRAARREAVRHAPAGPGSHAVVWRLPARQRAVAVLRLVDQRSEADTADILGLDDGTVRRELRAAVLTAQAEQQAAGGPPALSRLLWSIGAEVREVDHADRAWRAARARQTQVRRRVGAAVAVAALVLAAATAVGGSRSSSPPVESRLLTSLPAEVPLWRLSGDGSAYVEAPPAGTEHSVARLDAGLPEVIDPDQGVRRASEVGFGVPSVFADAVYLRGLSPGRWEPVLVWRTGDQLDVDTLQLTDVVTPTGERRSPLGVHAFSNDRTAIAFPQPGRVVVLRTATGTIESIPVPSPTLDRVWWFGGWLMAGSEKETWQIGGTDDRHATRQPEAYGLVEYRTDNGTPVLDDHVPYQRPLLVGWPRTRPYGPTVSSAAHVASAFSIDGVAGRGIDAVRPKQVIVAIDGTGQQHLLVLGEERPRASGCCPVLGWTVDLDLVYADTGADGTWLMAWNVQSGQVRRLSHWLTSDTVPPVMALGVRFTAG
ncbi:sigma factor-like helix-turn-helix DNA-binding protein [Monashia sp. NPDC004114]